VACPAEIPRLSVDYENREFIVTAELVLRATRSAVFRVLSDYPGWVRLNRNITDSALVTPGLRGQVRVRSRTRACLLFLCRNIVQTQVVTHHDGTELVAVTEPEADSLRQGWVRWRLDDRGTSTYVRLDARLAPDFWLPPLIGPWSVRSVLRGQVLETAHNLERLAAAGGR
jgi:hypothetical protein